MKTSTFFSRWITVLLILLCTTLNVVAQRNFATTQQNGRSDVLCLGCVVNDAGLAVDGNLQTHSTLQVAVGVAASTYQELIFPGPGKVAANTPVTVKLGTGDNLLDLTLLGGVTLQAYNGTTPVGGAIAAATLLSALSNNNELQLSITPTAPYDRLRITLNGGLLGLLSTIYVYDAFYTGNANVACNNAFDELHGVSSALLGLGVDVGGIANPQNAIDGNINTSSTLNAGIAALGAYAQQTVIYERLSTVGDSVRLTMALPPALLDVGVLSNISISTYNGNTSNDDAVFLNSSLISLRLLDLAGGRQRFTVTYAPTKTFDRVQLRLGGGVASLLSSLDLFEAEKLIPRPVIRFNNVATDNANVCAGSPVSLMAVAVPNTTFKWYTQPTGGTAVFTGANYSPGLLAATTSYYVSAVRNGCTDESERAKITVTVNPIPVAPVIINNDIAVCPGGTVTFTANPVAGVTVKWYATATSTTVLATGNSFTTPVINATTAYYAEASTGGTCPSPTRTIATATLSPLPVVPTLTANNVTICDGDVAILSIASPVAGQTYNWYTTATGGTPVYTGVNFTTPVLNANAVYYSAAVNATGCESATRVQANVTVSPKPVSPVLAANAQSITAGQTATINVTNAQTGITYRWYTSANAATAVFTGNSYTTPALYTNATYYVSAFNAAGCESVARTAITINVTINNNSPCTFANTQTGNTSGLCVGCFIENGALAADADTTTASTLHVIAGLLGAYQEQNMVFQQPGFAGDTVKLVLQSPVGLADVSLLSQISVALYNGTTEVNRYTLDNNLLTLRLLGAGNRYAVYIPATAGYDRVQIRLNAGVLGLLSALDVYYAIQQYPKPAFINASPQICSGSPATLSVTPPASGTFSWYAAPTGGTVLATGNSYTTGNLTTTATYYVEYSRGGCVAPVRYPITVNVNNPPSKPTVIPSTASITAGQTATFKATGATGTVINWYEAPTGGTAVFTGATFTTPVLSANKTYYAEAVLGECPSPDRTVASVTVTPIVVPSIAVVPPTQAIDPGTSATLVASSTTPNVTFNWYTQPTGGTIVYTGATFNTPSVFTPVTYYAEAVSQSGVKSATKAPGAITLNSVSTSPVPCDAAIAQTNSVGGGLLCALCGISNANGAIDNDRNTFSQLAVPIGVLGGYADQTLRFANTGRAGDSIVVELGIPGSLASVGVLSQISLATYNGATFNNDRTTVDGALLNVTLLNNTSRFRIVFKANADFDRVEIRLNSGVAGVFTTLNIYDASQSVAAPTVTAASVTACAGSQATLTATAPAHVTIKWYTSSTGGTPVATGATFNTPALTSTTTYYAEASRTADGCTQSVRTPVVVTVTPAPAAPIVTVPTVTVCSGQPATFTANTVAGVTFAWYATPTGGTALATGNTYTTAPLNASATYYVEAQGAGGCGSSARTQVTANVTATPLVPTVQQATVQSCSGSVATLTASSTQPGVTFNWYSAATGGTPVYTGATFVTPQLTASRSYFVDATLGTCVSATRAQVSVNVNPTPANPTVVVTPAGGQISSGQTATLTASSTTAGATFKWYTTATGGTAIFTGASFTTPALTSNMTYYVEAVLTATGCTSTSRTPVNVTVNPIFSTSCDFASTQLTDVNGGLACLGCAIDNGNNSVDTDTTNFARLNMPIAVVGSYVAQQLIFGDAGLAGDSVTVKIAIPATIASATVLNQLQIASYNGGTYNNDRVDLSNSLIGLRILAGGQSAIIKFKTGGAYDRVEIRLNSAAAALFNTADIYYATKQVNAPKVNASTVNICAGSTATFSVSNPTPGVSYTWYTTATGSAVAGTGATFTTNPLNATTTYYVGSSRTSNGCANPNRVAVTANVTQVPVNPILNQNAATICAGDNATFTVTNAGTSIVKWYNAATNGTLLFTGPSYSVTPLITTSYYAEIDNGTCISPARTATTVTVNPRPAQPGVDAANLQVCTGGTATLRVTSPAAGVTYNWYTTATAGTVAYTGATVTTAPISQNTTFYVEAMNNAGGCINNGSRTAVTVNVTGLAAAPTLNATNTTVCSGGSVTISVNNPLPGQTYSFYTSATAIAPVYTGTTYTLTNVTANTSLFVEAANGTCTSATRTRADITVTPAPTAPQVQGPAGGLVACAGSEFTIAIANPQADLVYRWYSAATGGTLLYTGTQYSTNISASTTFYVEAASAGNCNPSARTPVTVTVSPLPPDPTLTATSVVVCPGSTATLSVAAPQAGTTYRWYSSPAQTTVLFTGPTYVTDDILATTNFYVAAFNSNGCSSSNLAMVQVAVSALPAPPVIANNAPVSTCAGSNATLTVTNAQAGYTYNFYTVATGGTPAFTGTSYVTPNLNATTHYYVETVNSTGCASSARADITVTVNALPSAPVASATGTQICANSATTLTATNDAGTTLKWYAAATGGTALFSGASFTTPVLTVNTTYYVEAIGTAGCTSATRTPVAVTVSTIPANPAVTAASVPVCIGSSATLNVASPQTGITYRWYSSSTSTVVLFTGATYVTDPISVNTNFYVAAYNATGCSSTGRTLVQVVAQAAPAAPVVANGNPVSTCAGSNATLTVTNAQAGYTYNFYTVATGGTPAFTGTSYVTPNLTATTHYYVETVSNTGCISNSRTDVTVTVNPVPTAPVASATGTQICANNTTTLTATSDAGTTLKWYAAATGGTALFTGANFTTPTLTVNTTYYVEAVGTAGCASATRTPVAVTVSTIPANPAVTAASVPVCIGSSATLSVASPQTGITYKWFSSSTSTVVLFTGANYVTDPISANTNFYVAAYNATDCSSTNRTLVQVVAQVAPAAAVVANGNPVSTCANASATLTVTNAQVGYTYNFYTVATGGTPAFTGTSYVTPNLTATTHYYVEAVNSTGCTSNSRTDVTVTVNQVPTAPVASATGTQICANNTTTLTATSDAGSTLKWYTAATGGTALFTGANFTTPVLTANTTYYVEAVGAAGCASLTRTPVAVTVSAIPANPVVTSASVPVCIGSSATLSVSSPQAGIIYRWYSSSTSTVVLFTGANYVTDPINANTSFYVAAYSGTDCSSTNRTMVQVVAQPAPAAPVVANGNPVSTCAGSNATLTVTNPQAGYTYKFYTVALGGSSVFTGTSYVTPNLSATTTYYVEAINSTGCPSAARTTVTVTVNQVPAVPVVTNAGAQICPNNTIMLTATTAGGNTLKWYAAATGGTALFTGTSFTTPVLTASTTYYVEAVNAGGCTSATRAAVSVKVLGALAAPVVTVQTTTASSITFAYAAVPDATGYEVSTDNGSTFITPSSGTNGLTHTIGGLNPNQSVTIIVRALGNSSCQLSANSNAITGISANPFGDGIFVPNAFTPNGDGNNDVLYVYGTNIKSLTFAVYNQWGEQQFRTTNKAAGWDGTYKGTAQPVGVYVYYVDVTLNSGQVVRKKGTVTLIR